MPRDTATALPTPSTSATSNQRRLPPPRGGGGTGRNSGMACICMVSGSGGGCPNPGGTGSCCHDPHGDADMSDQALVRRDPPSDGTGGHRHMAGRFGEIVENLFIPRRLGIYGLEQGGHVWLEFVRDGFSG